MNRRLYLLPLLLVASGWGHTCGVLADDPNCIQPNFDPNVVDFNLPAGVVIRGALIHPRPQAPAPATWQVPAGKYNRVGKACDPDGDAIVSIEILAATVPATVSLQPISGTWTLAADLVAGLNVFTVRAFDVPGDECIVTLVLWARNRRPVLY